MKKIILVILTMTVLLACISAIADEQSETTVSKIDMTKW